MAVPSPLGAFMDAARENEPPMTLAGAVMQTLGTTDGNVVDALYSIADALGEVADAIKADTAAKAKPAKAKKAAPEEPAETTAIIAVANKKAPNG